MEVRLKFNEQISGPLEEDENPFADRTADIGFVCASTFRWLRKDLDLLPVPVPADIRAKGQPVYFADVLVRVSSPYQSFQDLRGQRWGYNDRNSRSGWFSMLERIAPYSPLDYFSEIVQSGSHLESLRSVLTGKIDAAAIDSNALLYQVNQNQLDAAEFRVLETWGPFPIQPIVVRAGLPNSLKQAIRKSLLQAHEAYSAELSSFGFLWFAEANRKDYLISPY